MRHRNTTKTLGRKKAAKSALVRDLATSVVVYEKITTTQAKAKVVKPVVEKLITVAKKGDLAAQRRLYSFFTTRQPVEKMIKVIGPRYKSKNGGYTRIIKIGPRQGDSAEMVQLELV